MKLITLLSLALLCAACTPKKEVRTTGDVERLDPALDAIIAPGAKPEIIAEGYDWSEGPLWIEDKQMLLFSDVPQNVVYRWTEAKGAEKYLTPSGYTGDIPRGGEMGSNGLLLDDEGNLVLCQHGDRRLAIMKAPLDAPKAEFTTIAALYNGKRFSSPNDAVFRNYDFYMTDPMYGLEKRMDDPAKEIPFQGVYRIAASGAVQVLVDSLTRPNGIAFSPDGNYLVVANSDSTKAKWYRFDFQDSVVTGGKVLYDATSLTASVKGLPDGLKIDSQGNIFATGPGGVFIFNLDGKLLGKIRLPEKASNCALSADEKTLFVTNDMYVVRVRLR